MTAKKAKENTTYRPLLSNIPGPQNSNLAISKNCILKNGERRTRRAVGKQMFACPSTGCSSITCPTHLATAPFHENISFIESIFQHYVKEMQIPVSRSLLTENYPSQSLRFGVLLRNLWLQNGDFTPVLGEWKTHRGYLKPLVRSWSFSISFVFTSTPL